jgi:hypothetical protein
MAPVIRGRSQHDTYWQLQTCLNLQLTPLEHRAAIQGSTPLLAKDASQVSKKAEDMPSAEESAEVMPETSKGNQMCQASIVLTEEL